MPNYDYHCPSCFHKTEVFQKMSDSPLEICPSCKKSGLRRGPGGGIGLLFNGPGFYINDYDPARKPSETNCNKNE